MKLIEKIKSLFNKGISTPSIAGDRPVTVSNPKGVIKIGEKLTVDENYVAVICTKGKVCDIFVKGEYELTPGLMQKANRVRKLSIPNKKGKYKKDFKGFVYYINLKQFEDQFSSYNGVIVRERKLFTSTIGFKGNFSYKIQNPKKFMEMLIMEYYNVSGELPNEKMRLLTGQYTEKFIQSKKLKFSYFYNNNPTISEGLIDYMKKQFATIGIDLISININSYIISKKLLKQIETGRIFVKDVATVYEDKQNKEQALEQIVENEQDQITLNIDSISNYENDVFDNKLDFDMAKDQINKDDTQQQNYLDANAKNDNNNNLDINFQSNNYQDDLFEETFKTLNNNESQYKNEIKFQNETTSSESGKNFIESEEVTEDEDEDEDEGVVTADIIKIKKCNECGASNSKDSEKCFNCGTSFVRSCEKCGHSLKDDEYVCSNCGSIVI